jgi:hypothetical protein
MAGKTNGEVDKAKKQSTISLLDDLAKELDEGFIEDTFEVHGIFWKMRLLQDHESNWANGYQRTNSAMAMLSSRRAPTLAIGIREIGKKNEMKQVRQFFIDEWVKTRGEMDEATRQILDNTNDYVQQYFFAEQLFQWLSKRPSEFVQALWVKWQLLEERRTKAEEVMGKSSTEDGTLKEPTPTHSSVTSETIPT